MNSLTPTVPTVLWHFTCVDHGHPGIYGSGLVKPSGTGLAWFTDLELGDRLATGLIPVSLKCDRGAIRYRIDDTSEIVPWLEFRRHGVDPELVHALESTPGVMPRHWFVAWTPVAAEYDPV